MKKLRLPQDRWPQHIPRGQLDQTIWGGAILLMVSFLIVWNTGQVFAQKSPLSPIAISIPILENKVNDGTLVCTYGDTFIPCSSPYSSTIFGVVTENPIIEIQDLSVDNPVALLQDGQTYIRVSTSNGPISRGDPLTSSNNPGVAMKATQQGPIMGFALESYTETNPDVEGKIIGSLNFEGSFSTLTKVENALESTPKFLRVLLAALVVVICLVYSFIQFRRSSQSGIQALGRNPMASRNIQTSLIVNYGVTALFAGFGLVAAYLIVTVQ